MRRRIEGPAGAAALVLAATSLAACGPSAEGGGLEVMKALATEPVMGERAALYLFIANHSTFDDVLVGVSSPAAARAEIHRTVEDGGGGRMQKIGGIPIPSDSSIALRAGGYHVMLLDLREAFERGDTLLVVLQFRMAGERAIRAPVVSHAEIEAALEGEQQEETGD